MRAGPVGQAVVMGYDLFMGKRPPDCLIATPVARLRDPDAFTLEAEFMLLDRMTEIGTVP